MIVFELSPELGDGERWEVTDNPERVAECVRAWLGEFKATEGGFRVRSVKMSKREYDALREL